MTERQFDPAATQDMERQATATQREPEESTLSTADLAAGRTPPQPEEASATTPGREAAKPDAAPLFAGDQAEEFRRRWEQIQTGFVDEPRRAVEQADSLVAEVMQRLAQVFADERAKLEEQWSRGDNISTEELRVALQRYRSFFDRLLAI